MNDLLISRRFLNISAKISVICGKLTFHVFIKVFIFK